MSLPPEIRNMIYQLVVKSERDVQIGRIWQPLPGILQVNHIIRKDALGMYFDINRFTFTYVCNVHNLRVWFRRLVRVLLLSILAIRRIHLIFHFAQCTWPYHEVFRPHDGLADQLFRLKCDQVLPRIRFTTPFPYFETHIKLLHRQGLVALVHEYGDLTSNEAMAYYA